jgi:hypothetical protein
MTLKEQEMKQRQKENEENKKEAGYNSKGG